MSTWTPPLGAALALLMALATLFAAGPRQALACSCAGVSHDEAAVRDLVARSAAVVVGTVSKWQAIAPDADGYTTIATISVHRVHDGAVSDTIKVYTGDSAGGCGYEAAFREGGGREHLLSLTKDDAGRLNASYCTSFPMTDIAVAEGDYEQRLLGFLNTLESVAPSYPPTFEDDYRGDDFAGDDDAPPDWVLSGLLGIGAVSIVGLAAWVVRRQSS